MAAHDALRTALLTLVLVGACRCDDGPEPIRKAEAPPERQSEGVLPKLPEPEGAVFDPQALASALPAKLGDATPEGDVRTESSPLANGGSTSTASRTYVNGDQSVTVQISDMQHAPLLREAIARAKERFEKGESPSWKTATVQGHDAVVQHLAAQRVAIANVIASERLFVNVRVDPADDANIALEWANKVPLEPITKLQPPGSAQPQPSPQPPPL